jgi:hypothetical protein
MISQKLNKETYFYSIGIITLICISAAWITNQFALAIIPLFLVLFAYSLFNFKSIYFLLFASMPICIEWDIPEVSQPICP